MSVGIIAGTSIANVALSVANVLTWFDDDMLFRVRYASLELVRRFAEDLRTPDLSMFETLSGAEK